MIEGLLTIIAIYVGILFMIKTDKNRELYTDYQIRNMLIKAKILYQ